MFALTDAEWDVMDVLWTDGAQTQTEIREHLTARGTRWAGNTVHTFLTRLEKKGAVTIDRAAVPHRYRACAAREACEAQALSRLKRRVFGGSADRLVSALLREENVTAKELAALRRYLDTHMPPSDGEGTK